MMKRSRVCEPPTPRKPRPLLSVLMSKLLSALDWGLVSLERWGPGLEGGRRVSLF